MSIVNTVQNKIQELSGGEFEKFFDAYAYKKYGFKNIQTLGIQTGTNKPTKGTPDSYVITDDRKFILITCTTVRDGVVSKIKSDILCCLDNSKVTIARDKIQKIICGHTSTNISIDQFDDIKSMIGDIEVELVGIDTISHDIVYRHPVLAKDFLNISIDSNQFFDIDDFVRSCDKTRLNAPLECDFWFRESELKQVIDYVSSCKMTVVIGASGIGKTRLALETCRYFRDQGWTTFCIKNNGNLLYDDIPRYLDDYGNYLLFLDDANQIISLSNLLDYVFSLPDGYTVNILMTVRNYAGERVFDAVRKYDKPGLVALKRFKDNEIKEILKKNLGIINPEYLNRIANIANGNARLAILAGVRSVDDGLSSLRNVEDIYENYYGSVLKDATLTREDIIYMTILAIVGPVNLGANPFYQELLSKYMANSKIDEIIQKLCELELIDWFKGEVANVSDQTMGDYMLYYALYKNKLISLCAILDEYFPRYKDRIIYIINTLLTRFSSQSLESFIIRQIKMAWDKCMGDDEKYVDSFFTVEPVKSLSSLKQIIEQSDNRELGFTEDVIEKQKNRCDISSRVVRILSGFKYTDYYDEAIDLLFMYYTKRPDLFMDFYYAITNKLLYDKYSYYHRYQKESIILSRLWEQCETGENYPLTLLYIHIAEVALRTEIDYLEEGSHGREVVFCRTTLVLTDEIKKIRSELWKALFTLRERDDYKDTINSLIIKRHVNGLDENATREFILFDFNMIYPFIEGMLDYHTAKVLDLYRKDMDHLRMRIDDRLRRARENEYYRLYSILAGEYTYGRSMKENEEIRRDEIWKEIRNYSMDDFNALFRACEYIFSVEADRTWELESGLAQVFRLIEEDVQWYRKVLDLFLNHEIPINSSTIIEMVYYLLNNITYQEVRDTVLNREFKSRDEWLFSVWSYMPEKSINKEMAEEFIQFIRNHNTGFIPDVTVLSRYCRADDRFLDVVISVLISDRDASGRFLRGCFNDEDILMLLKLFAGRENDLCRLYANTFGLKIDYEGKLFRKLYLYNPAIWEQYIDSLKTSYYHDYNENNIIEYIWSTPEYKEKVRYAFDVLVDGVYYFNDRTAELLFGKSDEKKKKEWLIEQLNDPRNDLSVIKKLINIVALSYPDWEVEYVVEYLKRNNSISDFRKIHLHPFSRAWTGSEIPLINKDIRLLEELNDRLKGHEFLEHKQYLDEQLNDKRKYKERAEVREYLEDTTQCGCNLLWTSDYIAC